jgi:predicted small lipoprotein YifL
MKKVISLLAVALMIVGLTGCMDPQDGTKQRPAASSSLAL